MPDAARSSGAARGAVRPGEGSDEVRRGRAARPTAPDAAAAGAEPVAASGGAAGGSGPEPGAPGPISAATGGAAGTESDASGPATAAAAGSLRGAAGLPGPEPDSADPKRAAERAPWAFPGAETGVSEGAAVRAEAARIRALFEAAGAEPFETGVLQPAGPLLDLYGEDIRARAYVTADPLRGERMLRPDFTVAVVRAHLARGAGAARHAYAGEVFRRQEVAGRPCEYLQVGLEILDPADPAARDAEALAAVLAACEGAAVEAVTGDMGLLTAAVRGLSASRRRRAMLLRHVWRPERFRALLERFGRVRGREVPSEAAIAAAGPEIGERGAREVAQRLRALREDAAEPPLPRVQIEVLGALLALGGSAGAVLGPLRALGSELSSLAPAADAFARRLDALSARGIDPGALRFEASLGRATMEYYDGFVFQLRAAERGGPGSASAPAGRERPPVASGGRYDALVRALGGDVPAVGAIVRPAELLAARA